jgi:hypothetical protein
VVCINHFSYDSIGQHKNISYVQLKNLCIRIKCRAFYDIVMMSNKKKDKTQKQNLSMMIKTSIKLQICE